MSVEITELMGHAPAKVDEKGRLKLPTSFRRVIEDRYGKDCFITSFEGQKAQLYPLEVWREFQSRLAKVPSTSPAKQRILERANYYGQLASLDAQGRLLIPQVLREVASIREEVVVLGSQDHLVVWNEEKIEKRLTESPLTDDDYKELELHGV